MGVWGFRWGRVGGFGEGGFVGFGGVVSLLLRFEGWFAGWTGSGKKSGSSGEGEIVLVLE